MSGLVFRYYDRHNLQSFLENGFPMYCVSTRMGDAQSANPHLMLATAVPVYSIDQLLPQKRKLSQSKLSFEEQAFGGATIETMLEHSEWYTALNSLAQPTGNGRHQLNREAASIAIADISREILEAYADMPVWLLINKGDETSTLIESLLDTKETNERLFISHVSYKRQRYALAPSAANIASSIHYHLANTGSARLIPGTLLDYDGSARSVRTYQQQIA